MLPPQHANPWRALVERTRDINTIVVRLFENAAWPFVDLAIRFWLAKIFFISGMLKLMHWTTAIELAAHEYPVAWLTPVTAATVGVSIETVAALLLASGFMTRYAAMALGMLTLTIQLAYQALDTQLFWMGLFGWYSINGAGPLSVDHLLRRGLVDSALPLIPRFLRFSAWVRQRLGTLYLSLLRIWLALALVFSAAERHRTVRSDWTLVALPLDIASQVPSVLALVGGALLLLGLGTRLLAITMAAALLAAAMVDPRTTDAVYLLMSLVLIGCQGGGLISIDSLAIAFLDKHLPPERSLDALRGLPRVVIVGAGFAGVSCAKALRATRVAVTLIDRANYHLFQPLLYQVATAALSPGDIAAPVRQLFRHSPNVRVLMGTLTRVDPTTRQVTVDSQTLPYDFLVLATGATHSYFGKDAWASYAPGLKRVEDAQQIRGRILTAFERAEAAVAPEERAALLTFLIVGGGPTGVELAGAIAELARFGMEKEFRTFDPADAHVILVQSAPRLLPAFSESLARIAQRSLEKLGVEVMLGSRVEMIDSMGVMVSGRRVIARTVLWAAGVAASPAARWLAAEADAAGRVKVGPNLEVPGLSNVFVVGDTAACNAWNGNPVPGLAPAAKQAGAHAAALIKARVEGTREPSAFRYHHLGSLATIGRKAAWLSSDSSGSGAHRRGGYGASCTSPCSSASETESRPWSTGFGLLDPGGRYSPHHERRSEPGDPS